MAALVNHHRSAGRLHGCIALFGPSPAPVGDKGRFFVRAENHAIRRHAHGYFIYHFFLFKVNDCKSVVAVSRYKRHFCILAKSYAAGVRRPLVNGWDWDISPPGPFSGGVGLCLYQPSPCRAKPGPALVNGYPVHRGGHLFKGQKLLLAAIRSVQYHQPLVQFCKRECMVMRQRQVYGPARKRRDLASGPQHLATGYQGHFAHLLGEKGYSDREAKAK